MNQQSDNKKKPARSLCLRRIYIIAAVIIFLCIFAGLIYRTMTWEPKSDPESEAIIRNLVMIQLKINSYKLTDEDFARVTDLSIEHHKLHDIKLLKKFVNLQELNLNYLAYPQENIPRWKLYLQKTGIFNFSERKYLDLSPLKKLSNLRILDISYTQVSDLEPLEDLTNLHTLYVDSTQVTDLKPLSGLINLQILHLEDTRVSDLEPIKELRKLNDIWMQNCPGITDEQVKDLQNALPNLNIIR